MQSMQNLQRRACRKFRNNYLSKQLFRTRERHQSQGHLDLKPGIRGLLLQSSWSSRPLGGPRVTALQAFSSCGGRWGCHRCCWRRGGAALGLGFHSPEHPGRLRTPSPSRGPAGLTVARVLAGGAGVVSGAGWLLWAFPSVIGRSLLHPLLIPRVGGEAGPWRLQHLSPVLNSRRRRRRSLPLFGCAILTFAVV